MFAGVTFVQEICREYLAQNFVGTITALPLYIHFVHVLSKIYFLAMFGSFLMCSCIMQRAFCTTPILWTAQAHVISRRSFNKIPYDLLCSTIECPHLTVDRFVVSFLSVILWHDFHYSPL